jgi:thiol-disulfide isomerase/thioredoxin
VKRRTLIVGAVAGGGALAGASLAIWRSRPGVPVADATGPIDVWSLTFAGVEGRPVAMVRLHGKALLLNFWATWCAPCATEMPLLNAFAQTAPNRGWNVLALAVDAADPVRRFLAERRLSLPVALAGEDGLDLSRSLGNSVGALPFTVAFSADGVPMQHRLGALDAHMLETWVTTLGR